MEQNYKEIAIKLFKQGQFELAKISLSMAYNKLPSDELLAFIEFCDIAKDNPNDAFSLFAIYFDPDQDDNTQIFNEMIEIMQSSVQDGD